MCVTTNPVLFCAPRSLTFEILIFTFQNALDLPQEVFIHRCTHLFHVFWTVDKKPAYPIARLGRARTILIKLYFVWKEESHIHLMPWGGVKLRLILRCRLVNYPLNKMLTNLKIYFNNCFRHCLQTLFLPYSKNLSSYLSTIIYLLSI